VSWLQNVLTGESKIRSEIEELARRSRDKTLPADERLKAMFELGMVVQGGERLQEMIDTLNQEAEEQEPEHKWVNGARVKT